MPKQSPKDKARKLRVVQQKRMDHGDRSFKYWLMGIFGVVAIVALIVGLYSLNDEQTNPSLLRVGTGDLVELDYKLWIDEDRDGSIDISKDPYDEGIFETDIYSSYHNGLPEEKGRLIHGFYLNILDMRINQTNTFTLPPGVDSNGDGYDDNDPSKIVLSYGSGELVNTTLYFWVKIMNIEKGTDESTGLKVNSYMTNPTEIIVMQIGNTQDLKKLIGQIKVLT